MGKFWSLVFLLVPVLGVAAFVWRHATASGCRATFRNTATRSTTCSTSSWCSPGWCSSPPRWRCSGSCGGTTATPNKRSGEIHARQPQPGSRLDDPAGGHAAVHRHLSDERLGRLKIRKPRRWLPRSKSPAGNSSGGCAIRARTASSARRTTSIAVNDLHVPVNEDILVDLKSMDVLHDFFLPNLRVKQDAVPGMMIPVWFRADETGTLRPGLCRAVRLGALQDERAADRRDRGSKIRRLARNDK